MWLYKRLFERSLGGWGLVSTRVYFLRKNKFYRIELWSSPVILWTIWSGLLISDTMWSCCLNVTVSTSQHKRVICQLTRRSPMRLIQTTNGDLCVGLRRLRAVTKHIWSCGNENTLQQCSFAGWGELMKPLGCYWRCLGYLKTTGSCRISRVASQCFNSTFL